MKIDTYRKPEKAGLLFLLLALVRFLCAPTYAQAPVWIELGGTNSFSFGGAPHLSLVSDPYGNIYTAGWLRNRDGNCYVAQWNRATNTWSELGGTNSLQGAHGELVHYIDSDKDGNVYAAGSIRSTPDQYYVAKWDKTTNTWSELGGAQSLKANGWLYALATDPLGNVYAGGDFRNANWNKYVAKWDKATNTWSELGGDNSLKASHSIHDLCLTPEGNLYATGTFLNSSGNRYVAKWDKATNTWSELGGDNSLKANGGIISVEIDKGGNVYAAGYFKNAYGNYYVAKWDRATNTWSELGGINSLKANQVIEDVIEAGGEIYAAGYFTNSSGSVYVAKWDPTTNTWSEAGGDNSLKANKFIFSMTRDPNGNIYAGGGFSNPFYNCYVAYLAPPLAITTISPLAGCNAAPVTITGRGFSGATRVTIGGIPVSSFTVVSASIITAVPAANSSGVVSVTTPIGTSTYDRYTTVAPQAAEISISTLDDTICSGSTASFSAAVVNGGNNPSFRWEINGTPAGVNNETFTTNKLVDGDIIRCILTPDHACPIPSSVTSNIITMKVQASVTPALSIYASDEFICEGEAVTFTTSQLNTGPSPVYQWRKNGTNIGNNSPSFTAASFFNNDTITCILTANAACLTKNTAISNKVILKVAPNPVTSLDRTDYLCEESSRILDPGSFARYQWSDNSTGRTLAVDTIGAYYVTVTDNNGCSSSDTTVISRIITPPHDFLPADTAICSYGKLELKVRNLYDHYVWSTNATTPTLIVDRPGVYELRVTDNTGCTGKDEIVVKLKECLKGLYVPSAFTPNHDGKNDQLKAVIFGPIKQYQFTVYNRWGQVVFQTIDHLQGWDGTYRGKLQDQNVFVWTCRFQLEGEEVKLEKGSVLLIQ